MSLQQYVQQVRPRSEAYIPPVDKIQDLLEYSVLFETEEEKTIDVDKYFSALKDNTPALESAPVLIGTYGKDIKPSQVMAGIGGGVGDFHPKAKKLIDTFLKKYGESDALDALVEWIKIIGGSVMTVGNGNETFTDIIHNSVGEYYKAMPSFLETETGAKANTADAVFMTKGKKEDLISALKNKELKQKMVIIGKKGRISIPDMGVEWFQVSLKKGTQGDARIGKITTFINKNYVQGKEGTMVISKGTDVEIINTAEWDKYKKLGWKKEKAKISSVVGAKGVVSGEMDEGFYEFLDNSEYYLTEGWFGDVVDKFKNVIKGGVKTFVNWAKGVYTKVAKVITGFAERITNSHIKRHKGMKALNAIVQDFSLQEATDDDNKLVTIDDKMKKNFIVLKKEMIDQSQIKKQHDINSKLIASLNVKMNETRKGANQPPILMKASDAFFLSDADKTTRQNIKKILNDALRRKNPITEIKRGELRPVLKLGMNYCANVAIFGILKGIENKQKDYNNLSQSLYALAAEFESEAKFGNTSLPLVIVYGGIKGKAVVLGTRQNYETKSKEELIDLGNEFNDFPVLVFRINQSGGTSPYNVVKFFLVYNFASDGESSVVPEYMVYDIQSQSGSGFQTKIEATTVSRNY